MDIQETISRARRDYKDYLREKHPDWAESSLSTHVSDAFYLYQNTIALSFWKCFESDESMAAAKQDILEYLKHDVVSERAEDRTAGYFNDLKMLKAGQGFHCPKYLVTSLWIQLRSRLIQDHHIWPHNQHTGNSHALHLAA